MSDQHYRNKTKRVTLREDRKWEVVHEVGNATARLFEYLFDMTHRKDWGFTLAPYVRCSKVSEVKVRQYLSKLKKHNLFYMTKTTDKDGHECFHYSIGKPAVCCTRYYAKVFGTEFENEIYPKFTLETMRQHLLETNLPDNTQQDILNVFIEYHAAHGRNDDWLLNDKVEPQLTLPAGAVTPPEAVQ